MNFLPIHSPLEPEQLDNMLAFGYYRMQQCLFTTNFAHTDTQTMVSVVWARILLNGFLENHRLHSLRKRNKRFFLELKAAQIDDEIENLYAQYRAAINFDGNDSVASCLLGSASKDHFPGKMWLVRDAGRLIAAGYFDVGANSAAGILNFFHPEYKKFSLGLWLYFESVAYAAMKNFDFFYPGYISDDFKKFDYKLEVGPERIELWHPQFNFWLPYSREILKIIAEGNKLSD